ncbi:MAG: 5-formyltetrahydrofolate cyclo-ligase [Chlamydiales bacterium]|nr:5-formyltetrahydrofolate cyclo-ligase [Chlamydiales bacterium]
MSLPDEIDTSLFNRYLATTHRLLLPKVVGSALKIYHVTDLNKELERQAFGLLEPIPALCREASAEEIEVVLVPALGFDQKKHRIGYGKGYYDRFLSTLPACPTIGVGFHEQLIERLPTEATDHSLTHLSLF